MYTEGSQPRAKVCVMGKEIAKTNSLFSSLKKVTETAGTGDLAPIEIKERGIPYVGFFSNKANKAAEIREALPGITPGAAYLFDPETGYTRLTNFKFHLLNRALFWVQRDAENKPIKASVSDPKDMRGPLRENYETLILVYKDDKTVVPAKCTFNVAKSRAGEAATKALQECNSEEWFRRSPEHELTKQIPDPTYRFTAHVTSWVAPAKSSGFPTVHAKATIKPTSMAELGIVAQNIESPGFADKLETAKSAFLSTVAELSKLAGA